MSTNTSFTRKVLEAHITLAEGGFNTATGETANTKILRLGMDVDIKKPGGEEKNKATVKIFNLPLADMEVLTTLAFQPLQVSKNAIAIYAGDEEHGLTLAFSGDIVSAVPNFNSAPDPSFDIECITGYVASVTPVPPLTGPGAQDAAALLKRLAADMKLAFVNRGVTGAFIRNPAFVGGPMQQARQIASAVRISLIVDDGEMVIAPYGELRRDDDEGTTPVWKDKTGMFGYPGFDNEGIKAKGIYEPKLQLGGPLRIESIVPRASGLWQVQSLSHKLQANYPGAKSWESEVKASYPGQTQKKGGQGARK